MALHQDGGEFLLSYPQLSIKHLLVTIFLTPACLWRRECPPVNIKHNSSALSPMMDAQVKNCNIGIQTIGKAL